MSSSNNYYAFSDDEDGDGDGAQGSSHQLQAGPSRGPSHAAAPSSRQQSYALDEDEDVIGFTPPRRCHQRGPTDEDYHPSSDRPTSPSALAAAPPPAIVRLQRIWVAERACPELLSWTGGSRTMGIGPTSSTQYRCDEAVDEVCAQIEQQVSILILLTADENTSEEEHLRLSVVQLDVERAKWLLRAYLRTRISKLESHSAHYAGLPHQHLTCILSPLEQAYLKKFNSLRTSHLTAAVTSYLPESLQSLQEDNMVQHPDTKNTPVFVRCIEDCGNVTMDDGQDAYLGKDSVHLVVYDKVRRLISQGRVELL